MNGKKWFILLLALMLMAGTAGALSWLRVNQKLGSPAIKGTPVPGTPRLDIQLPERVLDFTSTNLPEGKEILSYLPADTSYSGRFYFDPDGLTIQSTVILMGADRTSIHRPEYCLPGHGYTIGEKSIVDIPIHDQPPYQLKVARWNIGMSVKQSNGQDVKYGGVYVYWYVADNEETPDHDKMLGLLTMDLFKTGKLQRWAYISYFAACPVGRENETFEQIKRLIIAQVPAFQLPLKQK